MDIYINNKLQQLPPGSNITDALHNLGIASQKGIAVAINNSVVPAGGWADCVLNEKDKLTIIKATQGG